MTLFCGHLAFLLGDVTELTWPGFLKTYYMKCSQCTAVLLREISPHKKASDIYYIQTCKGNWPKVLAILSAQGSNNWVFYIILFYIFSTK